MSPVCIKALVSGKVQGVFFRASTVEKAKSLQLTGQVRNTEDGHVEVIACGESENVMLLVEWLWEGSPAAKVSNVNFQEIPWQDYDEFATTR